MTTSIARRLALTVAAAGALTVGFAAPAIAAPSAPVTHCENTTNLQGGGTVTPCLSFQGGQVRAYAVFSSAPANCTFSLQLWHNHSQFSPSTPCSDVASLVLTAATAANDSYLTGVLVQPGNVQAYTSYYDAP
ncbi:hypothetical protein GCM10009765_04020 [Fodinicola feengrottensis]|uniref:Secreted protein n=1 Tax=Fodinicola feengrottensis TaxID=435914 RepID=A0ABN2FSZ3_9ACTN